MGVCKNHEWCFSAKIRNKKTLLGAPGAGSNTWFAVELFNLIFARQKCIIVAMFRKTTYCLWVFLIVLCTGTAMAQGLRIMGNSYPIHERTAIDLFSERSSLKQGTLSERLGLSFDLRLDKGHAYGSVLRIKLLDPAKTLNLFCRRLDTGLLEFKLTEEGKGQLSTITLDPSSFRKDQWIPVVLDVDIAQGRINWHILDKKSSVAFPYRSITYEGIYLGKHDINIDVADCSIRELELSLDQERIGIPFRESRGNVIHDLSGRATGTVSHPVWLINESFYWKNSYSLDLQEPGGYQFDEASGRMLFFDRHKLRALDLSNYNLAEWTLEPALPIDIRLGNSFISGDSLYIYEVNDLAVGDPTVVSFNLETLQSKIVSRDYLDMQLHHHTGQRTRRIPYLLFGGFGNDRYSNAFLMLNTQMGRWDTIITSGDTIMPRYFTSSFYVPETEQLYLFGGMGNDVGDNTLGRSYRYDLYRLDLASFHLQRLWEKQWSGSTLVPTRNLVQEGSDAFYALMYPEYRSASALQLYRFSMKDGIHIQLGDSIPIRSEKIKTNANLFFYRQMNTFYAVTQEFDADEIRSKVTVYELRAPAVTAAQLDQYSRHPGSNGRWYILMAMGLMGLGSIAYLWLRRRRRARANLAAPTSAQPEAAPQQLPTKNAVYLFGKFDVFDEKGTNIAHLFSSRQKQVLLLFLAQYPGKGIDSAELSKQLWPEKEIPATKNIRGVTLNQFRKLLSYLQGITLVYSDGCYRLQITNCFVDLLAFREALVHHEEDGPLTAAILNRGRFLKNTEHELFDNWKEEVEHKVVAILHRQLKEAFERADYARCIQLSRLCLDSAPLDLEAAAYEIKSMMRLKQRIEARQRFEHFRAFYQGIMEEPLPFTFDKLPD
ncbi:AfsR/SARP family transcriptional regulator [Olivibacter sitiensis]|uniref:AfsR/SARP family transcriptional regulator n=1 Tax=Olivibacter sitiensis TaxID=376470 RepID=UPI0004163DFD|nr:hypothetical protein [Olivibacter sitiensis]